MVLPYGQRENYYTLLFLFKFLIYPVSDRLATGVSYCWTNLPSTSKYPAANMGFSLFWWRWSADLKVAGFTEYFCSIESFCLSFSCYLALLCPSQTGGSSLAQGQLLNSLAQLPGEETTVVQPLQLAGVAAGPYTHHALSWER